MSAEVAGAIARVRAWREDRRRAGQRVGFVPTMGALHRGHGRLIEVARERSEAVAVSIFVNPLQFDRKDDLERYPRTLDADLKICNELGVDFVFAPPVNEMYAVEPLCTVTVKRLTDGLCGRFRPGHFDGVATVVAKLLCAVRPDIAVFGEKDFQQLAVIRRMTQDLELGVEILGVPTVRDADGLALSSRNAYLSAHERGRALALPHALEEARDAIHSGKPVEPVLDRARDRLSDAGFSRIDYFALVDSETLEPLETASGEMRLIAAAVIGNTRLIDNVRVVSATG